MPHRVPQADPALIAALRQDLRRAAFTVDGVLDVLGPVAAAALAREEPLPARRVTRDLADPRAILIRLFTLGDPVDAGEVQSALPTLGVVGATDLGLVRAEGSGVVALCDLRPYAADDDSWWLASDLAELALRSPLPGDHVLGIGGASATLASWTVRPEVDAALDLGTGSGVQALHLAKHARTVTVTDLSERALGFARFNALLNELTWEVCRGSLFEPVAGRRFDLIVSNPPFVITPRDGAVPVFDYRDGGGSGDDIVAGLIRSVGEHLEPGGIAQFLGNWEIRDGGDWRDRVRSWVDGTGLDAWIVQREVQDPAQYAEIWSRDGGHHSGTAQYHGMYAAWLDDFARREVTGIGFGVITLQRPPDGQDPFVDLVEVRGELAAPMGPHILAGLRARRWLAEHDDASILDTAWRCASDVTQERHFVPGESDPRAMVLVQGGGLRRRVALSTVTAAYISVADGELTARRAGVAIAALLEADQQAVLAEIATFVRDCARDGLLARE